MDKVTVIRSKDKDACVRELTGCSVLLEMARELWGHPQQRADFQEGGYMAMIIASREYEKRKGPVEQTHIGACFEAINRLFARWERKTNER